MPGPSDYRTLLREPGHLLLDTRAGDLDVLGSIDPGTCYDGTLRAPTRRRLQ